jgi:hypothetical protein
LVRHPRVRCISPRPSWARAVKLIIRARSVRLVRANMPGPKSRPLTDKERAGIAAEQKPRPKAQPHMVGTGTAAAAGRKLRDRGRQIDDLVESQVTRR